VEVYHNIVSFPKGTHVATIGFFDGVHIGHRFLLENLKKEAALLNKKSMVISFEQHPKTIIPSDYIPTLLTDNDEKIELLAELGINTCILLPFDKKMANLSAFEFLKEIIFEKLGVHTLFIGYNHRFGKNRTEGILEYKIYGEKLGLNIIEGKPYELGEEHVSSSVIRKLIELGEVEKAKVFLTYAYHFKGLVVKGMQLGRSLGFPTANLQLSDSRKTIPGKGVYAVSVCIENEWFKGVLNIGERPTVSQTKEMTIEVHIVNFDGDIYNKEITVFFLLKIRDEKKFNSLKKLKEQISLDKNYVVNLPENTFNVHSK
jgi:riboflavin kinase/FMN adenylyltransferase